MGTIVPGRRLSSGAGGAPSEGLLPWELQIQPRLSLGLNLCWVNLVEPPRGPTRACHHHRALSLHLPLLAHVDGSQLWGLDVSPAKGPQAPKLQPLFPTSWRSGMLR